MEQSIYTSKETFEKTITNLVKESVHRFNPDFIIFPEYTLVFLALLPYEKEIAGSTSKEEAIMKIMQNNPKIGSARDIFLYHANSVKKISDKIFGTLSAKYDLYILAGTYFAKEKSIFQKPDLFNRALVYNPVGKCFYSQDKVFLTDFEKNAIGLSEGKMKTAQGFSLAEWDIGITICRDSYSPGWEKQFSGKDLWIDIKANGTLFTEQEKASFKRALPLRLKNTDVPYGITLCLTGEFLDFFWQGESSCIRKNNSGIEYLKTSNTATEGDILLFTLDP